MRVAVFESEHHAADGVIRHLIEAGHDVVRCVERGARAFPCAALTDAGCPVDRGVDVAVTVRPHVRPRPTPLEQGVTCILRLGIPLVIVGHGGTLNPYEQWRPVLASATDVVRACEDAVSAPTANHLD